MILIYGLILPSAGRNKVKLEIIVEIKRPSDATKNDLSMHELIAFTLFRKLCDGCKVQIF